jgi:hypothetical protein
MSKKTLIWFITIVNILTGLCLQNSVFATNLEDLSGSVAYLKESNDPTSKVGTGFFVTFQKQYLVTAAHVAKFITSRSILTMRNPGDTPLTVSFNSLYPGVVELPWHFHPEADVAILELPLSSLDSKTRQFFDRRFFFVDMLNADETAPQRERPLVVMGFPLALGTTGRFSPLTIEAKAASGLLRMKRFDTNTEATFFVLDKPSIGGYSGAPVFLMPWPYADSASLKFMDRASPDAQPKCVGIVHGTLSDNTGGKLAAIVPVVFAVRMIIEESLKSPPK